MSRINAILLLVSFMVTFAAVKALPIATTDHGAADMVNAVTQLAERKLIITSCGILGNSCAFAITDENEANPATLSNAEEGVVATESAKVNTTDTTSFATPTEAGPAFEGPATELAIRDPKLIITSCGILGNSCAFVAPAEADEDIKVDAADEDHAASIKLVYEDPAVKEAADHLIERMLDDTLTDNVSVEKAEAALPNAFMMINAVIG